MTTVAALPLWKAGNTRIRICDDDVLMAYNVNDLYIGGAIEREGAYAPAEADLVTQLLTPGDVVIEGGANIGTMTIPIARAVAPGGVIHAFEPQRHAFQTLCANAVINGIENVFARNEAVGQTLGMMRIADLNPGQPRNFGGVELGETLGPASLAVQVTTIDAMWLSRCDFIKLDVEGMELAALRGARETIARFKPLLYVENDRNDQSKALIEEIFAAGYRAYWHLPRVFASRRIPVSVNMLCIPRDIDTAVEGLFEIEGTDERPKLPAVT